MVCNFRAVLFLFLSFNIKHGLSCNLYSNQVIVFHCSMQFVCNFQKLLSCLCYVQSKGLCKVWGIHTSIAPGRSLTYQTFTCCMVDTPVIWTTHLTPQQQVLKNHPPWNSSAVSALAPASTAQHLRGSCLWVPAVRWGEVRITQLRSCLWSARMLSIESLRQ